MTSVPREAARSRDDLVEERKAAILTAAEELIAVHGFDALRLRDVAKAAGVSIGLIQHYFVTRDELLGETMRTASTRRARQWSQLAEGHEGAHAQLTALLDGSISDRHRCVVWLETCAAATRHADLLPDVQRTQDAWRHAIREVIEDGVASQEFSPTLPVGEVVELLVSLIDGLMLGTAVEAIDKTMQQHRVQLLREAGRRLLGAADSSSSR